MGQKRGCAASVQEKNNVSIFDRLTREGGGGVGKGVRGQNTIDVVSLFFCLPKKRTSRVFLLSHLSTQADHN